MIHRNRVWGFREICTTLGSFMYRRSIGDMKELHRAQGLEGVMRGFWEQQPAQMENR